VDTRAGTRPRLRRKARVIATAAVAGLIVLAAFSFVRSHLDNIVGRSANLTINVGPGPCTQPDFVDFAGYRWDTAQVAWHAWGRGPEAGRFVVTSPDHARFTSAADGHSITFDRIGQFSALHCAVGWADAPPDP